MKNYAAAFTVVKDEGVLLPVWLRYYSKFFDKLYVINHHNKDDSIIEAHKQYDFEEIVDDRGADSESDERATDSWTAAVVANEHQHEFLKEYKVVLHAHVDEFVVPDPSKYEDLWEYMSDMKNDVVYTTGYQLIQMDDEPPLQYDVPMLSQRHWWTKDISYNKPLLVTKPIIWVEGIHKEAGVKDEDLDKLADPNLLTVHVHFADLNLYKKRSQYRNNMDMFRKFHKAKELIPERYRNIV